MSKVTKKIAKLLLYLLSGVVLVAILFILAVAMLFSMPRVQTFVAGEATNWFSEKYGVNISVRAISLENITTLTAEDLYVEDLAGDTLLWVSKLSGKIDRDALLNEGRFVPYDAKIRDAKFYLIEDSLRQNNSDKLIRHIESFFPADTTSESKPFSIKNIEAERVRFKLYSPTLAGLTPESAIDYSDMDLMVHSAHFGDITVDGIDVYLSDITNLNVVDKRGAELHHSSLGRLWVGKALLDFRDIDFYTGGSHLFLPYLVISGPDWKQFKYFNDRCNLSLELKDTSIEPLSAGKWVAELGDFGLEGENLNGTFDGKVNNFNTAVTGTLYSSELEVTGSVQHIVRPQEITATVDLKLNATPEKVANIYRSVLHESMPSEIGVWVEKFRSLAVEAHAEVKPEEIYTRAHLDTDLGGLDIDGTLNYGADKFAFEGEIATNKMELGKIVGVDALGKADVALRGRVDMNDGHTSGNINASATRLALGGYTYESIELGATIADSLLHATLSSGDPNAILYAEGEGLFIKEAPEYNLSLNVERLNFSELGVGSVEQNSWLSGDMEASLRGASLDDMVGRAMINNLTYATKADTLSTELVNLSLAGGERDKSFSLYSPIVDVEYRSAASYNDVFAYLTKTLPTQLPLGNTATPEEGAENDTTFGTRLYAADDHTAVSVNIKEGERLAAVLLPNANLAPDSSLNIEFSPKAEEFGMLLESDYVALDDVVISRLRIEAEGAKSTINLEAECEELLAMGLTIPEVSFTAGAKSGNNVDMALFFSNTDAALSGRLAASGHIARLPKGGIGVVANIADSYLITPSHRWDIAAQNIDYSPSGVLIEQFSAENGEGGLFVDGELSNSQRKAINLSLRNIALEEWIATLANIKGVGGIADGEVTLYSALSNPYGKGSLSLSSLSAAGVQIDPMEVDVEIPRRTSTILASLSNKVGDTTLAQGYYDYSSGDYEASINIDDINLSLLSPLTTDIVHNLQGNGHIDLSLTGLREKLNIDGSVRVEDFGAKVDFTGANYAASKVEINFENNRGTIAPIRIEDGNGGWADVEGYINLQDLSNIDYSLSLVPHNLVAIDLGENDGGAFYGKVFASGGARLSSQGGNTEISGAIRTGSGSVFNLPLTGNNDFAGADFVTFVDRSEEAQEESLELIAQKKIEMMKRQLRRIVGNTTIDMMLGVDTGTLLRLIIDPETENTIEARGVADLGISLDRNKNDFAVRGDYEISEGVYNFNFQNLITKQFTINPNSHIRWNGDPLGANIDLGATLRLKTSLAPLLGSESVSSRASTPVECIVNLTGSLENVNVSFDINVPNANTEYQSILSSYFSSQEMMATQFVYLLTLGNFYSDTAPEQTNTAGAASTAIGLEFLAAQVSKLVSNDAYKFNLNYKAIDDTSSSYSIDFETEIIDDRLLLELEANVDTGDYYKFGNSNGNQLSGGGAITLLLDDSGDFYLKGFSRTIDRFDENQGLQENGVGLYYQRSFNRLSDLWRKKKSRTSDDSEKSDNFVTTSPEDTNKQQEKKGE